MKEPFTNPLRAIPSVESLLEHPEISQLIEQTSRTFIVNQLRHILHRFRQKPTERIEQVWTQAEILNSILLILKGSVSSSTTPRLRRVINATGVILHTNLGRAPLSPKGIKQLLETGAHYSNLEYNLENGERGKRDVFADQLLRDILGCEQAIVVNNCASAVFLALNTLAEGGEVLISRGELVEIGDGFRIPDILRKSGAILKEIGTTNRTGISDYVNALTDRTRLILRVHQSNFKMIGFTAKPSLEELLNLSTEKAIPLLEDQGSGCLIDMKSVGLGNEPTPRASLNLGVPLVCFSGDKLLGGPQAGIIAGKTSWVSQLRRNPLFRALRVDKLTLTILESNLISYLKGSEREEVPVWRMMGMSLEELENRAGAILKRLVSISSDWDIRIIDGVSVIGGGSAPEAGLPTRLIAIRSSSHSTNQLESELRQTEPPVIARVEDDQLLLDLRTVFQDEEDELVRALNKLMKFSESAVGEHQS